jgi:hypothetical protein
MSVRKSSTVTSSESKLLIGQATKVPQAQYFGLLQVQPIKGVGEVLPGQGSARSRDPQFCVIQADMRPARSQQVDATMPQHRDDPQQPPRSTLAENSANSP